MESAHKGTQAVRVTVIACFPWNLTPCSRCDVGWPSSQSPRPAWWSQHQEGYFVWFELTPIRERPIYTERLFGAATKKTDKTLLLVLRFVKARPLRSLCLFFTFVMVSGLFCCVLVPGTLAFYLLHTLINCDCLVYSVSQSVTTQ